MWWHLAIRVIMMMFVMHHADGALDGDAEAPAIPAGVRDDVRECRGRVQMPGRIRGVSVGVGGRLSLWRFALYSLIDVAG